MKRILTLALFGSLALAGVAGVAAADVSLPAIFGDGMVLQRRAPLPVWGLASPGETVTVTLAGQSESAAAGDDGKWRVTLGPIEAGGPFELVVEGDNAVTLRDVLCGEVWLCGGQSNMEWPLNAAENGPAEVAAADFPQIRIFGVARATADAPAADVAAAWQVVTPQTAGPFSAVGYFFGRRIHGELGVPVGLIGSYWGGTRIEPWMTPDSLEQRGFADRLDEARRTIGAGRFRKPLDFASDTGNARPQWAGADWDDSGWGDAIVPGPMLSDQVDFNGAVWYRRHVDVPADLAGGAMTLRLGPVDDGDTTYFNGVRIAKTDVGNGSWDLPRVYAVPADLVQAGQNVIAVRVFDQFGPGAFKGTAGQLSLTADAGNEVLPLAGTWKVAVERVVAADPDVAASADLPAPEATPTMLYNGMIAPLAPYAVRGFLWYQGESNAGEPQEYAALLRGLIDGWRTAFAGPAGETPQPVLVVQLANFMQRGDDPGVAPDWALLRQAQQQVSEDKGNGLAVTIDIGDSGDIHPRNKRDVGERLARVALRDSYGRAGVVAQGPTLQSATADAGRVVLRFAHGDGLLLKGAADETFAVGGADGRFVWATPQVEGETVVLSFGGVASPATVRYAWQNNPPAPLYNAAGLPAVPFEADVTAP